MIFLHISDGFKNVHSVWPWSAVALALLAAAISLIWYRIRLLKHVCKISPPSDNTQTALQSVSAATEILTSVSPHSAMTDDVKKSILEAARIALSTELITLFTIDPVTGGIECRSTEGITETTEAAFLELFSCDIAQREQREPWVVRNIPQSDTINKKVQSELAEAGICSIIACPIRSKSSATGALAAFYKGEIGCIDDAVAIIRMIAAQASASLSYAMTIEQSSCLLDDLAGANRELSEQATIDGLTGLANHRTFQQTLGNMCRKITRPHEKAFTLVMVDVDHFKIYNDVHGHQQGDVVLKKVAQTMASSLRQGDLAARYGGEEFALIFNHADKDDTSRAADRIRRAIAEQDFGQGIVTVSMGVAEFPIDGATPSELVESADKALYHAKITGRNRVYVYGSAGIRSNMASDDGTPEKSVLVVEPYQEGTSQQLIRDALSMQYCSTDCANNTAEATELLKTRTYDIAFVSTEALPDHDLKSLSTFASIHPHMPIVLVAGNLPAKQTREALRMGASDILHLPYNAAELPTLIERNLERQRIERQRLLEKSNSVMLQAIEALVSAIDARDSHAAGHSARVASFAIAISDHLDLSNEEKYALELAAKLHDVGKLALPDSALNKQSALTDEEWKAMKEHPITGARIVGAIDQLAYVSNIIRHHHEKLDGTGYPDGLIGAAIPLLSRIIAVADAYEAMTSERAHRKRLTPKEAIEELALHVDTWYSDDIVKVLRQHLIDREDI